MNGRARTGYLKRVSQGDVMGSWSTTEREFMERALLIAERGRGRVSPNPLVGCVLVKDGRVIAEGWHDHLGGLHAEQMAIADAEKNGVSPNGATAYVTLEPCNHFGRTPPCTEALMWAGVEKVVIAHNDPNPTVRGRGIDALQAAGITTEIGLLEQEAHQQMRSFLHWCAHRRPLVTVKLAVDAHFSVDERNEESRRFTSHGCLEKVHELRSNCDAILVGVGTILRDDPQLTVRVGQPTQQPLRIVIDPHQRCPSDAQVLQNPERTMLIQDEFVSLESLLNKLGDLEIQRILVEGGPTTITSFFDAGLVDEMYLIQSEVKHRLPFVTDLTPEKIESFGLVLRQQLVWGSEQVSYFSRLHLTECE